MQVYSNELYHYGVIGMKWGVRRYQNEDGSLTSRGRKRYGTEEHLNAKRDYKAANKQYSTDFNAAYRKRLHAWSPSKKQRDKEDERWDKAMDSAQKLRDAKQKYKVARKEAKPAIKEARKLTDEQKAKIKKGLKIGAAIAGTAIVAYGAYKIGSKAIARHKLSGKLAAERLARSNFAFSETISKDGTISGRISKDMANFANRTNQKIGSYTPKSMLNTYEYRSGNFWKGKQGLVSRSTKNGITSVYNFDPKTGKYFKWNY